MLEENGFEEPLLEQDAVNILLKYSWPGNIRELRNFCENLVVLIEGRNYPYDLDPRFSHAVFENQEDQELLDHISSNSLSVEENEKRLLRNAFFNLSGNRTKAAELMGVSRRTFIVNLVRWPEFDIN